jgi:hypothetical protein
MSKQRRLPNMREFACIRGSQKTGKIDTTLTAGSSAMLTLWAMQNTTSTKVAYVFNLETGDVVTICTGVKGRNFPEVERHPVLNIEDVIPGILLAMGEEGKDNE